MDSSVWGSSDSEMDLIVKERERREEEIQKEELRKRREKEIEEGVHFAESSIGFHADKLVMFLGYIKGLTVRESLTTWIEEEKKVWDALKRAIHTYRMEGTDAKAAGIEIIKTIDRVIETKERSIDRIREYFST